MEQSPAPNPEDLNLLLVVIHQVEDWWKAFVTGGFVLVGAFIWRASRRYTQAEIALEGHEKRLAQAERAIRALELGQQAIALKLESLPTRTETTDQFRSVRDDIRALINSNGHA